MSLLPQSRRLRTGVLAATALLALTGCSQSTDTAATVGGQAISTDDVRVVSDALCSERAAADPSQATGAVARSQLEDQALQALISAELTAGFTKDAAYSSDELNTQLASVQPLIDRLPADEQPRAKELITDIFISQIRLTDVGKKAAGKQQVQPDQAYALGVQSRQAYDKKSDVDVNPRYRITGPGDGGAGSTSLSVSASEFAKAADKVDPQWAAELPAAQRCG